MGQKLPSLASVLAKTPSPNHSSTKLPSLSSVLGKGPAPTTPQHHGSFVGNLVHDAEGAAANIVPGVVGLVEHPVRGAEAIGHQYAQTYGPLVHGDLGKFWERVHAHPLGPILDAASLLTLGVGSAAHVAEAAGLSSALRAADEAGQLGRVGQVAKAALSREPETLSVPNLAKQAGQDGEDVAVRKSSSNPLIRARQVGVNKALNRARPDLPLVGSQARFARTVGRRSLKEAQAQALKGNAFEQSFARLSNAEKAAWHLKMQQIDPQTYVALLAEKAVKDPAGTEAAMTTALKDETLNHLFHSPSKKLTDALAKGRELSDQMTVAKVARGVLDETSAAERPYLPQRLLTGDKQADIPTLAEALAHKGEVQPSYVPHSAETGKLPTRSFRPSSLNPPAPTGSMKLNEGTLFEKGMLNLHGDALSRENRLFARHMGRSDVNAALISHAAKEPATGLPEGYEYLKTVTGQKTEPYTRRAAGDLKKALEVPEEQSLRDRYFTRDRNDPNIAVDGEGHRLIVPSKVADHLSPEARPTSGIVRKLLYNRPTSVWKHLVLGLRPAYFANIVLSQHILGALQMAGGLHGVTAYLNHLVPGARLGKLDDHTVAEVMPEQAHGTFSGTEGATSNKGLAVTSKAYQGVMPATLKIESWLRRLMIEGWAKATPEVRDALARNGGDINAALREVHQTHPHVIEEISRRVDHAQGNYRTYSPAEQKLRQIVPFYGWDRHIVQSTYRLLSERPTLSNLGVKTGQLGQQKTQHDLGALPTYLQGVVKLGGIPGFMGPLGGRTAVLSTKAVGPFAADADLLRIAESAVHGRAGTSPEEANNINPLLAAFIEQMTGRNLATGSTLKDKLPFGALNVPIRAAANLPQARILEQAIGWHPAGQSRHPTSSPDVRSQIAALLGVPMKKLDLNAAHRIAAKQGQPPR